MLKKIMVSFTALYFSGVLFAKDAPNASSTPDPSTSFAARPEVQLFMDEVAQKYQIAKPKLVNWFSQSQTQQSILDLMTSPAEGKPWYKYRPIFVNDARAKAGAKFWRLHAEEVAQAAQRYQVAPEMIVAILGVETNYGSNSGNFSVLQALATLAFDYPPRAKYFRSELEQFLLLMKEEAADPLQIKGSYAGAMGIAQFMPSSYRQYAVDGDGDGRRDLWHNVKDATFSIANYFKQHGWEPGEKIAVRAEASSEAATKLLVKGMKPQSRIEELSRFGVKIATPLPKDRLAALVQLEGDSGPEYWVGLQNFYVITRYNKSPLYAMAASQLSELIRDYYDKLQ